MMALANEERLAADIEDNAISCDDLHVSLLGGFRLQQGDAAVPLKTTSYQSLLAYLIIHTDQAFPRQKLAFQFWPDSTESQARTNLRKALYRLRHTLPDAGSFLRVKPETVQWRRDAPCTVDVWEFETAVAQSQQATLANDRQSHLEQAVSAYHGDFLPAHYDDWILATRESYRRQYLSALEELLALAENQRRYTQAIELARKLLRKDPLHEVAYRRLMRLQSLNGNVAGALRTYHDCSTRLQRELGVDPGPATQEAYERLLQTKTPRAPLSPSRLPLVGRDKAWQALLAAWARCRRDQPQAVFITGEAGIGKTRLAEELLDWAERQGIMVLSAVCYPAEKQLAYAPVAALLRSEHMGPIFRHLGSRHLVECSRLLPELKDQKPDLPSPGPLTEAWQRQHLFSTLALALLRLPQPFLLFVDDLPWCDQDTLDWLLYLLSFDPEASFLLMGAARSEEMVREHGLVAWQRQLEKEGRLTPVHLRRLDVHDSARLAGQVLNRTLDQVQADRLYAETEGNPLFVVEIARSGLASESSGKKDDRLPPKVQSVIEARLARLSNPAYQLAQLAAVIGRSFTYALLDWSCKQDGDVIVRGLDELWQHRLIRERGTEAYDFSHDKIRQVLYDTLSQARRRQLHQQIWCALKVLHATNLEPVSGQIAAHCAAAGQYREAVAYYQQAARAAQAVYANEDTLDHLQRAIDLFAKADIDPQQGIEIYEQRGDVLITTGRYEEAEEVLLKAVPLTSDPLVQSRLHRKIANSQQLRRRHDLAFETWQTSEKNLGEMQDDWPQVYWQEWLWIQLDKSWVLYWSGRLGELESLLTKIHPIVEEQGTTEQQGILYHRLVLLSFRRDRLVLPDETIAHARTSLAIIEKSGTTSQVAFSHFTLGLALRNHGFSGKLEEAVHEFELSLNMARELHDIILQVRCLVHLCLTYLLQGDLNALENYLPETIGLVERANNLEYIVVTKGVQAWCAWQGNELEKSRQLAEDALLLLEELPFGWPTKWVAVLPLLSISLRQHDVEKAIGYARPLLEPGQQRLRDDLTTVLQAAIAAWENNQPDAARISLEQALGLAQTYQYL